jgi:hypothetical protein
MNQDRDEEIAASLGAHRDLGPGYDEAIASGLIDRIGAEIDRRVDQRISQRAAAPMPGGQPGGLPGVPPGGGEPVASQHRPISWQQTALALGSMVIGAIASATINNAHGNGVWPIIIVWMVILTVNMAGLRAGRPSRRGRSSR